MKEAAYIYNSETEMASNNLESNFPQTVISPPGIGDNNTAINTGDDDSNHSTINFRAAIL